MYTQQEGHPMYTQQEGHLSTVTSRRHSVVRTPLGGTPRYTCSRRDTPVHLQQEGHPVVNGS